MEALEGQWVHVSWVHPPLPGVVIPSGMALLIPCGVARCGVGLGLDLDLDLDHTIEVVVVEGAMNLLPLLLHFEGPEEVALEEDPQTDEGALVGAWVEDTVPTKALVGAWAVAVAIVLMKVLVGAWVEMVDIAPMKVLDMGDPMATGLMMSLVTEAMIIEDHLLMSTVAIMALAMEEVATEGTMEATAMEEVRTIPAPIWYLLYPRRLGVFIPGGARLNLRPPVPACVAVPTLALTPHPPALSERQFSGFMAIEVVRVVVT